MSVEQVTEIAQSNVRLCSQCGRECCVIDSRPATFAGFGAIRRRRECVRCGQRFTTIEIPLPTGTIRGLVGLALSGRLRDRLREVIDDVHALEQSMDPIRNPSAPESDQP